MNTTSPTGSRKLTQFKNLRQSEERTPARCFQLEMSDERQIHQLLSRGQHHVRVIKRALILRMSHLGRTGEQIRGQLDLSLRTVYRIRRKYRAGGLSEALPDKPRSGRPTKASLPLVGQIIALYCQSPPVGFVRWTYALLHQAGMNLFGWSISRASVHRYAQRHHLKPWQRRMWCIAQITPEYLKRMYEILDLYERPYDPTRPVICLDEKSIQVQSHFISPQTATITHSYREDHQYEKRGTLNLFVMTEALTATRLVQVTARRTKKEFAYTVQFLVERYSEAIEIHLVVDNLTTHTAEAFTRFLSPEIAAVVTTKIRWHYTPIHASWVNLAENEISVLERQCLNQRFEHYTHLIEMIQHWQNVRNQTAPVLTWLFSSADARHLFSRPPSDQLDSALASQDWTTLVQLSLQAQLERQHRHQIRCQKKVHRIRERKEHLKRTAGTAEPINQRPPYRFAHQPIPVTAVEDRITSEREPNSPHPPQTQTPPTFPSLFLS